MRIASASALAALALVAVAAAGSYQNAAPIPVPDAGGDFGSPTPNPVTSTVQVTEGGTVSAVSVTLAGVTSEAPDDLDVYLASPAGTKVMLWSDAGGDDTSGASPGAPRPAPLVPISSPTDVSFSDGAATGLPDEGPIAQGTYKPTDHPASNDFFCSGETDPAGPFGAGLSAFSGQPATGTWSLVLADDCVGFTSEVTSGWRLTLNAPTAAGVHGLTAVQARRGAVVRWRTSTEAATLGFDLYRSPGGKLNRRLIPAKAAGSAGGAAYAYVDARAGRAASYRLQLVRTDGSREWAGTAALSR